MSTKKSKALKIGSICEIQDSPKYCYVQYLGDFKYGNLVAVVPRQFSERVVDCQSLSEQQGIYAIYYPVRLAVREGLAAKAGDCPPLIEVPKVWRRPFYRPEGGVEKWFVDLEDGTTTVRPTPLTAEEARIAVAVVCNHERLLEDFRNGWSPNEFI